MVVRTKRLGNPNVEKLVIKQIFNFSFIYLYYFLKFRVPFFKENSRLYNNVFNYWRYYMSKLRFCWGWGGGGVPRGFQSLLNNWVVPRRDFDSFSASNMEVEGILELNCFWAQIWKLRFFLACFCMQFRQCYRFSDTLIILLP